MITPREEAALLLQAQWDGSARPTSLKALLYEQVAKAQIARDSLAHHIVGDKALYRALLEKVKLPEAKLMALIEKHAISHTRYETVRQYQQAPKQTPTSNAYAYQFASSLPAYRQYLPMLKVNQQIMNRQALQHVAENDTISATLSSDEKAVLATLRDYQGHKIVAREKWQQIKIDKQKKVAVPPTDYDAATRVSNARNAAAHALITHHDTLGTLWEKIQLSLHQPDKWCQQHATEHQKLVEVEAYSAAEAVVEKPPLAQKLADNYAGYKRALRQHKVDAIELTQSAWQHKKVALLVDANQNEKDWIHTVDAYLTANHDTRRAWAAISDKE